MFNISLTSSLFDKFHQWNHLSWSFLYVRICYKFNSFNQYRVIKFIYFYKCQFANFVFQGKCLFQLSCQTYPNIVFTLVLYFVLNVCGICVNILLLMPDIGNFVFSLNFSTSLVRGWPILLIFLLVSDLLELVLWPEYGLTWWVLYKHLKRICIW